MSALTEALSALLRMLLTLRWPFPELCNEEDVP